MSTFALTLVFAATSTVAQVPADMTERQQARAEVLYKEIRCPVCTAQAVAESDATLSKDLRRRIETLIVAGKTDEEVLQELTLTYGDDIRLRPAREARTVPLWAAPWVLLAGGLAVVLLRRRRRA